MKAAIAACEGQWLRRQIWAAAGSMIATLLLQSAAAFFWAGSINARMDNVEGDVARCEERIHTLENRPLAQISPLQSPIPNPSP